ncbi:MAG: hypothetical protein GX848_04665 [Clostridiales bacterium]|nr:hypothetical protein [Clostridiales bacterium]
MNVYQEISKTIASILAVLFAFLSIFGVLGNNYDDEQGATITYTTWQEDVDALLSMCGGSPLTSCGGTCEHAPSIIIPGIGQSESNLLDENNELVYDANGKPVTGWPLYINADELIEELAAPLVTAIATQKDNGFTDFASKTIANALRVNAIGLDGLPVNNVHITKYYKSLALCDETERKFIMNTIPIKGYAEEAGDDHLYFFAYNSFGDVIGIAEELFAYIQMVKAQTGHDKVNIVPISLGGTVFNALLEIHPEVADDLERVICIVPALDGSKIVSDVYNKELSLEDEMLYSELFPSLMPDDYTAYVINLAIRALPKQVVLDLLDKTIDELLDLVLINCTTMWALVASEDYPALAAKYLSDSDHDYIRERTALYYQSQLNSKDNILTLQSKGVEVFNIVDYGVPLISLVRSHKDYNADGIIHIDSTGMGAYTCVANETLGDDYVSVGANCTNPSHNHISPDGTLDASTSIIPEHSFYFYEQNHESTARNNIIMNLAIDLLIDKSITDIYSDSRYPQFMYARNTRGFFENEVPAAEEIILQSYLYDYQLVYDTQTALDRAYYMEQNGFVTTQEVNEIKDEIYDCLVRAGIKEEKSNDDEDMEKYLYMLLKAASDGVYDYYGPIGFSDFGQAEIWAILDAYKTMK